MTMYTSMITRISPEYKIKVWFAAVIFRTYKETLTILPFGVVSLKTIPSNRSITVLLFFQQ